MSADPEHTPAILRVESLKVHYGEEQTGIAAVRDVSFEVAAGEALGVVGESGSGKSQVFLAAMGLLARNARISGSVRFEGEELLGLAPATLNRIRGSKLTMIFQDPMSSLTPHVKIGVQLAEVLVHHAGSRGATPSARRSGCSSGSACPIRGAGCASIRTSCQGACASG